ncbi:putative bifunctional diguanylate cyclase/phosphodiesterase [Noviherbaspirillum aerium]|uniref:putative bifunctional diguanylate cyclase/phosphodiesterase n=1 Tax=Noviherbaspirillum aerium TaxID=2588497 RepID=UPI00124BE434|nr:EAL domain-containing protein [Noviherbaspirillum aerium]
MECIQVFDVSIAEHAADSVFITDTSARIIYQNPEARRVFRFPDEELFGRSIVESLHHHYPDGRPVPLEQCKVYRAAVLGESARDFIWQFIGRDGASVHASCTVSPFFCEGKRVGAILFATDITARRKAEQEAARNAEKLQLAMEAAEIAMFDHVVGERHLAWSPKLKEMFGLPADTVVTLDTFYAGIHPDDVEEVRRLILESARPGIDGRFQYEFRTIGQLDGKERWISVRGQTHFDGNGQAVRRVGVAVDITQRREAERRIQEAAQHDSLTGLPNRALLYEYCTHLFAQADRLHADCAVLFIDLDRFKPINDLYGHDVGDKVLQEVARRLLQCTRKEDIVSRLGGDEFIVVLPRVQGKEDSETVALHILESIRKTMHFNGLQISVSPSIGISLYRKDAASISELIRYADLAMYAAKRAGRDTFRHFITDYLHLAEDRVELEQRLKDALRSGTLKLLYQPVIDIGTGKPVGAEAFIRLPDNNGHLVSPDRFIPIAESAGLIDEVGFWVVSEACRQQQRWRDSGLSVSSMSINVSASQFRHPEFAMRFIAAIDEYGIEPGWMEIELTESALMENIPDAISKLDQLKARGIRIALDDFGTGYSNLGHLTSLPLDKLKIDRSFTDNLETNESGKSIADTILGIGRALDLQVVGEGIESEEAMNYLRDHGCNQVQGHLFSKPLAAPEFESWYRSRLGLYH